jgi:hypothetical protein
VTLLARVVSHLREREIPCALIGADAMAAHGVMRATIDQDLLAVDARALEPATWSALEQSGCIVDIRRGDSTDPLRGVVRITHTDSDRPLDLVVGRYEWQADAITRAKPIQFDDTSVPVVTTVDLVLLKLYAGGSQDAWDIERLLAGPDGAALRAQVDAHVSVLPRRSVELWTRLKTAE